MGLMAAGESLGSAPRALCWECQDPSFSPACTWPNTMESVISRERGADVFCVLISLCTPGTPKDMETPQVEVTVPGCHRPP